MDPVFIYVFDMGMAGAAFATILSQFISMVWILAYFLGKRSHHKIHVRNMRLKWATSSRLTALGLPSFFIQLANSLLNVVLNVNLTAYGGDIAVSGMGIVNSIQTILLMPITGLVQGTQPIISFNHGAKKFQRVWQAQKIAITSATAIVVLGWIVTRIAPELLVSMFNRDPELMSFSSFALQAWFSCLPVIGFQIVASNYFQATGKTTIAIILTLTRQFLLLLPAIFIFSNVWGLEGILYAAPFSDAVSVLLTGSLYVLAMRKLRHEIRLNDQLDFE